MAIRCGFFNSQNGDRKYSAEEMNEPLVGLVSNGVIVPNEDLPGGLTSPLKVVPKDGMTVKVLAGRGIFADKWFINDSDLVLELPENNTASRWVASVVVRIDTRNEYRKGTIEIKMQDGNPSMIPNINTTSGIREYRLANITVRGGATTISDADIQDTRGSADCGFCHGLIKQLSTDEFFTQWQALFDDWFNGVQIGLTTQATLVTSITSQYTTTLTETNIPIGIAQYDMNLDILEVYINGLRVHEGTDYIIDDNTRIVLTRSVYGGTKIMFNVLKSIDGSQAATIVTQFQELQQIVNDLKTDVRDMQNDTGWINFTLEGGAVAYPGLAPAVRKVGNVVYIRGAIYQVTDPQRVVCTLPETFAPSLEHYFSHVVGGTGAGVGYTTVRFKVNRSAAAGGNATITLNGATGSLNANMTIPMSTSFIVG